MERYSDGNGGQVDTYGNPISYGENSYYDSVNQLPITTTTTAGSFGADTSGYGMHSSGTGGGDYGMHSSGTGTGAINPGGGGGYGMHSSGTGTGDITPGSGGGYGMHSSGTGTGAINPGGGGYGMHSSSTGTGAITPGGGGYGMYSSGTGSGAFTSGGGSGIYSGGTYPDPYTTTGYHHQQSHIPSYTSPAGDYDGGVVHSTTTTTNDYGEKVQIHHDTRGVVEKIKDKLHLNHHH